MITPYSQLKGKCHFQVAISMEDKIKFFAPINGRRYFVKIYLL